MNEFDQCARQASKLDEVHFLAWVVRQYQPPGEWQFERWDDTRRKSWEGGPDRTNDLVAVLRHPTAAEQRQWLILEFESEPERFMFQRLGVYELLLSMEVAQRLGLGANDLLPVGSVVLYLTGQREATQVTLGVVGTAKGTRVEPLVINFQSIDARTTLADMAAGLTGLCLLIWIPLMAGGGDPLVIAEWKRLVLTETDEEKQKQYRAWALVLADLSREQVNWFQALENWKMLESKAIRVWRQQGELTGAVKTKREDFLELVRVQLQDPVPETIRLAVEGTNDPAILDRWFKAALRADNLAALLSAMKENP